MTAPKGGSIVPLGGFYFLYFGALGITLPFFPAYLKSLALSTSQVGVLLALPPLFSLIAPPLWAQLADRSGRADVVLSVLSIGAGASFSLLLAAQRFTSLLLVMGAYAAFNTSITPLIDSLTLERLTTSSGSYARVRLFGSIGFVLSSTIFGMAVSKIDRATVIVALCLMAGYFAWSLGIRTASVVADVGRQFGGFGLLADRDLAVFLTCTCLHWIACAPFHGTFSIHLQALGLRPTVVGLASGLGVSVETALMYFYPRFANRISAKHLLFVAFLASSLRWIGMAAVDRSVFIILLSLLHAFTFGAFYIASVAHVASRTPPQLRSSGQGLFVSVTFGIGGLIGYLLSGVGYDALGGHRLFAVAGLVELAAAWLILQIKPDPSVHSPRSAAAIGMPN